MEFQAGPSKIVLTEGDITKVPVDAIVNAANSRLAGGSGVDGAIHRAGGPSIMGELDEIRAEIGKCPTGDAVLTGAGKLPAKYVIHAVGPVYNNGKQGEPEKLASCYKRSLGLAKEKGARTVSFPSISTGVYGYPVADAAELALRTVRDWLAESDGSIESATFVLFGKEAFDAHAQAAKQVFGD